MTLAVLMPNEAYDIEMLDVDVSSGGTADGWCFGLPPGIRSEQWPLDSNSGYPLMHGFTLRLPEHYRVHGPDIVALSFFAVAPDHNDGGPLGHEALPSVIETPGDSPPDDEHLRPLWQHARQSHGRLHRMDDSLSCSYAIILLTELEYTGPFCQPPPMDSSNPYLRAAPAPKWLEVGSAAAFVDSTFSPHLGIPLEETYVVRSLHGIPDRRLDYSRALGTTVRAIDPNAGKAPTDYFAGVAASGYQSPYYGKDDAGDNEPYSLREWAQPHKADHIGGTMRPAQETPELSPFYIEFEEYLGGYNFGGGNAQLDFNKMRFDWACG